MQGRWNANSHPFGLPKMIGKLNGPSVIIVAWRPQNRLQHGMVTHPTHAAGSELDKPETQQNYKSFNQRKLVQGFVSKHASMLQLNRPIVRYPPRSAVTVINQIRSQRDEPGRPPDLL